MIDDLRREAVPRTTRLVEFLRDLASAGATVVRDVTDHEEVLWLADLPAGVSALASASSNDVLLSLDPVPREPSPRIPLDLAGWVEEGAALASTGQEPLMLERGPDPLALAETIDRADAPPSLAALHAEWLRRWRVWAEHDRALAPAREWHASLTRIAHQVAQRDDEVEFVVATGLLTWLTPSGQRVCTHLLTTRVGAAVDASTGRVDIVVGESSSRLQDRTVLDGEDGYDPGAAESVRQDVRGVEPVPLGDETKELLERWRSLALDSCYPYEHRDDPQAGVHRTAELRRAPALVLRRRDRSTLIDYYDRMLEVLSGPGAAAPLGLAQLVTTLETRDRLEWLEADGATSGEVVGTDPLFPLPANPEQRQVVERMRRDSGVVVQGPPGTGKTHTIANLVSALLARGQRVLVTSQKTQALTVLRDKLPPEIQELCVAMTDLGRGGSAELSRSVQAMSERYASHDPLAQTRLVETLTASRAQTRSRVSTLVEQVRALREAETYQHPPVAPGYSGTLAEIVAHLRRRGDCSWMPVPVPVGAGETPPLDEAEADELRRLLAGATPRRRARPAQSIPDAARLLQPSKVRSLVAAEAAATGAAADVETDLSRTIAPLPAASVEALREHVRGAARASAASGLPSDASTWRDDDWRSRAMADLLGRREVSVWTALAGLGDRAREVQHGVTALGLREVVLPSFGEGPESAPAQLSAGRTLRDWMAGGESLRRLLRPAVQKQASLLLESTVDGVPVTTVELLDVVLARLGAEVDSRALARRWAEVGYRLDGDLSLGRAVATIAEAHAALDAVMAVASTRDRVEQVLAEHGVYLRIDAWDRWRALSSALDAVTARQEAAAASERLNGEVERLEIAAVAPGAPPELHAMARSLAARDVERYGEVTAVLAAAGAEQQEQRRCDALLSRLSSAHPALASLVEASCADAETWGARLGVWEQAWAWGLATTFFDHQRAPGLEQQLEAQLAEATARVEKVTAELAAASAWQHCLARMTAAQASALRSYQQNVSDAGKRTGRYGHVYARAAREAMVEARGAVPAWIMALPEVLDTIPADRDSFDVVVIDEASQASIEAMFLLWLAPRVIVVGDDRQCAPSVVSHGELQPIFDKLDSYLPDLPHHLRVAFTPRSSLFSLLQTRFGTVIRLKEHFRCMPEIIDWSSRTFYGDMPLVPLRQYGGDRLPPLRLTHVAGAVTDGSLSTLRNVAEATAIVDQVLACTEDPAYAGRTFGVVVLQGTGQVRLIDTLLQERLPAEEIERRRLRVGTPPDFQGDERHVVFLSMVVAERRHAMTSRDAQRRFNVAASRAQDQTWLFASLTADLLKPDDLRRSLLDYVRNPPPPLSRTPLGDVTEDEPHEAFDSLFEQRVFLAIRARGYHVTPQYEVNGRRIDLVVTGATGRLAVECDGVVFHSSPSQVAADLDRERELKRAGWMFWRVRDSEFNHDREQALASLWPTIEKRCGSARVAPDGDPVSSGAADDAAGEWTPLVLPDEDEAVDVEEPADDPLPSVRRQPPSARRGGRGLRAVPLDTDVRGSGPDVRSDPPPSEQTASEPRPKIQTRRLYASAIQVHRWAVARGMAPPEDGRFRDEVVAAFNDDHPDMPYTPAP